MVCSPPMSTQMEDVLENMSDQSTPVIPKVSRKANGFNRSDVVNAFVQAFEIIGGVDRLAIWGNANPDKFYPLYAKLLPATTQVIGDIGQLEIIHRIAPTRLDQHPDGTYECPELSSDTNQDNTSPPSTPEISDGASSSPIDVQARLLPQSTT